MGVNRATCYLNLGLYKHCIKDAEAASEIDPHWFRPKYLIMRALIYRKRIKEAMTMYKQWQESEEVGDITLEEEIYTLLFSQADKKEGKEKNSILNVEKRKSKQKVEHKQISQD